jgi:xylulokinase
MVLAGIDLGTSNLKTILVDGEGRVLAVAAREYPIAMAAPDAAEQDPAHWLEAAAMTMRQALAQAGVNGEAVAAIGLSGQMHGLVCVDARGRVLRPAIIWPDRRTHEQVTEVYHRVGRKRLTEWTRNPLATGFQLVSWLWLRQHEPEIAAQTACVLLPKDYLRLWLTGERGTEPSDACATGCFDPAARIWCRPLWHKLDLDPRLWPPVAPSHIVAGGLRAEAATTLGLRPGIPVVYGGGDQACQAAGNGVLQPGDLSITIGTGGQILAPLSEPAYDPRLRLHCYCHVVPATWYLMAAILTAGLALRWLRDTFFPGADYGTLADRAATIPPGADGLLFLPHLAGERTPHMDPHATGAFVGLTLRHTADHFLRAVMEGVVFALRQGLDVMLACGVQAGYIMASGGGTRHPLWLQLLADICNRPVYVAATEEAAAFGAALLAGVGIGWWPDPIAACAATVRHRPTVIEPNPTHVEAYDALYRCFCRLYPILTSN